MTNEIKVPYGMWDVNGKWAHNKNLDISKSEQWQRNLANGFITESDDVFQTARGVLNRLGDTQGDYEVRYALIKCLDQIAQYELDNDYLNAIIDGSWDSADEVICNRRRELSKNPLGKPIEEVTLKMLNEKLDKLL